MVKFVTFIYMKNRLFLIPTTLEKVYSYNFLGSVEDSDPKFLAWFGRNHYRIRAAPDHKTKQTNWLKLDNFSLNRNAQLKKYKFLFFQKIPPKD